MSQAFIGSGYVHQIGMGVMGEVGDFVQCQRGSTVSLVALIREREHGPPLCLGPQEWREALSTSQAGCVLVAGRDRAWSWIGLVTHAFFGLYAAKRLQASMKIGYARCLSGLG